MTLNRKLLLYHRDGGSFDIAAATRALTGLSGLAAIRHHPSEEAVVEVDYQDNSGSATVRLNSSGDSILVTWSCDAALRAAVLLQQRYSTPIRAIDLDYSFDIDLSQITDCTALQQAIETR